MKKFVNEKIDLSDNVVIAKENVKILGEKIALCATKNARRFAFGQIDNLYAKLTYFTEIVFQMDMTLHKKQFAFYVVILDTN